MGGLAMLALVLWACDATPPEVDPIPSGTPDAGSAGYVDLIVSYTENGSPITCSESVGALCSVQTGPCADHAALGAPDGRTYQLEGNGQIELGFLCQPIVDRAEGSNLTADFRLVGTLDSGTGAVLSVSEDGTSYQVLDTVVSDNQEFDLANEGLELVRFVRIAGQGGATLSIDAIEVLQ
jgi:hypothetical protein